MFRILGILFLFTLLISVDYCHGAGDAAPAQTVTQREFAKRLVDAMGWGEGVPEKAVDRDYLSVLGGNRTYRFEAEETYDRQTDTVSVRNYSHFGSFSGKGWVHGITNSTAVHLKVFIPIAGRYTVKATAKGDGQLWSIAGKAFKKDFGNSFKEQTVGQISIPAGSLEFNAIIPPDGAIDVMEFTAPSLASIEPVAGWQLDSPLTKGQFAEIAAALLSVEALLPDEGKGGEKTFRLADINPLPFGVQTTDNPVFGKPVAPLWVRAGQAPIAVALPLTIDVASVYQIKVRYTGSPLTAGFGNRTVTVPGSPVLDWVDLGAFRLAKGNHILQFQLPSSGGIDVVQITRKISTPAAYLALEKMGKNSEERLLPAELTGAIKSLQDRFKERR